MLSGRQAAAILRSVLSSDEQARLLLRTGIAGSGVTTSTATLFDEAAVRELCLRPQVGRRELWRACPHGLYVARLHRGAALDLTRPWAEVAGQVAASIAQQRRLTALTAALTSAQIRVSGRLPFAATYLGFVVLTADLVAVGADRPSLTPPGPWADAVTGRQLHTRSGGRPGYLLTPPVVADGIIPARPGTPPRRPMRPR